MGWIFSETFKGTARLDGKTTIVTGSNTGLGMETAREFYKRGARVIMACRNLEKAKTAAEDIRQSMEGLSGVGELVIRELDLSSFENVRKCAKKLLETESAIHILVNNAGIVPSNKELTVDGFEHCFATNHLGPFLFTLLLLPRLIKSAPARIVNVSSKLHMFWYGNLGLNDINADMYWHNFFTYARSKLANILFAKELGKRLEGTGVTTYSLHPGAVNTDVFRYVREDAPLTDWFFEKITVHFLKTPVQGIQTILYCSLDKDSAHETGFYYAECAKCKPWLGYKHREKSKQLWKKSLRMVELEDFNPFIPA